MFKNTKYVHIMQRLRIKRDNQSWEYDLRRSFKEILILFAIVTIFKLSGILSIAIIAVAFSIAIGILLPELGLVLCFSKLLINYTFISFLVKANISPIFRLELFFFMGAFVGLFFSKHKLMIFKRRILKDLKWFLFVILPIIVAIFSMYGHDYLRIHQMNVLFYQHTYSVFLPLIFSLALVSQESFKKFFIFLFFMSLFATIFLLYQTMGRGIQKMISPEGVVRVFDESGNVVIPIAIGRMSSFLALLGLFFVFFLRGKMTRISGSIGIVAGLMLSVFANEKGPLVAAFMTGFYLLFIRFKKKENPKILRDIFIGLGIFIVIFKWAFTLTLRLGSRFSIEHLTQSWSRVDIFLKSIEVWLSHPVFGAGLNGLAYFYYPVNYPHNVILEIFLTGGIVGFLSSIPMVIGLKRSLKLKSKNIVIIVLNTLFIFSLFNAFVSGNFAANSLLFFSILSLIRMGIGKIDSQVNVQRLNFNYNRTN